VKSSETVDKSKPSIIWTYVSLGTVRFRVWSSYSRGQIHPGALRVRMMRCRLGFDTDELIKLLTRLGTFSCPGHQELATQCKKRNPGGSMFLPIHITCTEMRMAIIVSKKGGLRWQQMRKKPQRQGPLLTVQCGVASTLIQQVGA